MARVDFMSHKDEDALHRQCSSIIHDFFDVVNSRRLDPNETFWREDVDPNYSYSGLHGNSAEYEPMSLKTHLRYLEVRYKTEQPEFRITVRDVCTERLAGDLRSFVQYESLSAPLGVRKLCPAEVKWSCRDGRLKVLEVNTMSGIVV